MSKVYIENKGAMPMYVAGLMIAPGEGRHFEEWQVPPEHKPVAVEEVLELAPDPLQAILLGAVAAVVIGLPLLSLEELDRLAALEAAEGGKNRKGVLEGIAEEKLARAKKAAEAGAGGGDGVAGDGDAGAGAGDGSEGGAA